MKFYPENQIEIPGELFKQNNLDKNIMKHRRSPIHEANPMSDTFK
jgi:hypothetical protein